MKTVDNSAMQEALDALIGNLLASESFNRYQQAQICLDEDQEALSLLRKFSQAQMEVRKKQAGGTITQDEVETLRTLQDQVQHTGVIITYYQTQQEAIAFLREINEEISKLSGINFASFANHANCC